VIVPRTRSEGRRPPAYSGADATASRVKNARVGGDPCGRARNCKRRSRRSIRFRSAGARHRRPTLSRRAKVRIRCWLCLRRVCEGSLQR
jgi:hypothetical protein